MRARVDTNITLA